MTWQGFWEEREEYHFIPTTPGLHRFQRDETPMKPHWGASVSSPPNPSDQMCLAPLPWIHPRRRARRCLFFPRSPPLLAALAASSSSTRWHSPLPPSLSRSVHLQHRRRSRQRYLGTGTRREKQASSSLSSFSPAPPSQFLRHCNLHRKGCNFGPYLQATAGQMSDPPKETLLQIHGKSHLCFPHCLFVTCVNASDWLKNLGFMLLRYEQMIHFFPTMEQISRWCIAQ